MANCPPPKTEDALLDANFFPANREAVEWSDPPLNGGSSGQSLALADADQACGELRQSLTIHVPSGSSWSLPNGVGPWEVKWGAEMFSGGAHNANALSSAATAVGTKLDRQRLKRAKEDAWAAHLNLARTAKMDKLTGDALRANALVVDVAMLLSFRVVMELKATLGVPRPFDPVFNATWSPLLFSPAFSSHPGGHAAQSHLVAELLIALRPKENPNLLRNQAAQISADRIAVGLHTEPETMDGAGLGAWLAARMSSAGTQPGDYPSWSAVWSAAQAAW